MDIDTDTDMNLKFANQRNDFHCYSGSLIGLQTCEVVMLFRHMLSCRLAALDLRELHCKLIMNSYTCSLPADGRLQPFSWAPFGELFVCPRRRRCRSRPKLPLGTRSVPQASGLNVTSAYIAVSIIWKSWFWMSLEKYMNYYLGSMLGPLVVGSSHVRCMHISMLARMHVHLCARSCMHVRVYVYVYVYKRINQPTCICISINCRSECRDQGRRTEPRNPCNYAGQGKTSVCTPA